ncbi:MAG: phage holin family protein [Caldilineaceae bacterium]|nr:phage holin family protein [Caldilineaceae bacterium]HRJ45007.1 phage holin family protein [Caldilineaceae bacterium]
MSKLILRLVINAAALYAAAWIVPGVRLGEGPNVDVTTLLLVALIFGLINALIKPIVKLVTCPAYVLTLGLFTFVVNAGMLKLTAWISDGALSIDRFWDAVLAGIVISIISTALSIFVVEKDD